MSLASLPRPRLALRAIDRDGMCSATVSSRWLAHLAARDCDAYRLQREMFEITSVIRDWALDKWGAEIPAYPFEPVQRARLDSLMAPLPDRLDVLSHMLGEACRVRPSVSVVPGFYRRLCRWEQT